MNIQSQNERPQQAESMLVSARAGRQPELENVIRYERLADQGRQLALCGTEQDVLYIEESTPLPPPPSGQLGQAMQVRSSGEVVYIGPE